MTNQLVELPLSLQEVIQELESLYPHVQWGLSWEKKKGGRLSYIVPVTTDEWKTLEEIEGVCFFSSPLDVISIPRGSKNR